MKRKCMITAGIIALIMAMAAGCSSTKESTNSTTLTLENRDNENTEAQSQGEEAEPATPESTVEPPVENNDNSAQEDNNITPDASTENTNDTGLDTEIIGGKVRRVAQDSFVISRTLTDEDGYVAMPEEGSPEEELVTIRCTDSTIFEHWTIQGGGAGIETKEALFSDIQEGGGLEAEGYFDGEEFVARKVMIEVYI